MASPSLQGVDAEFDRRFQIAPPPAPEAAVAAYVAERQPALYTQMRVDRASMVLAVQHVVDELHSGRAAPLMLALMTRDRGVVGDMLVRLVHDRLVERATEQAQEEAQTYCRPGVSR